MSTQEILPKSLFGFFLHFLRKQKKSFIWMQIFLFAWSLDHTLFPYIISSLIDTINSLDSDKSQMWSHISFPLFLGILLWITIEFSNRFAGIIAAKAHPKLEADVRMAMFDYTQKHSYSYFNNHFAGNLGNKISDMPRSMNETLKLTMSLFLPVLLALGISTFFFARLHPIFAIILISWISIHILICCAFARKCDHLSNIHSESRSTLAGNIIDSFSNHLSSRLFSRHLYEINHLRKSQIDELNKHSASLWYIEKMKILLGIACFIGPGILLNYFMFDSWQKEIITTGEVVFIFNSSWNITMMAWIAGLELPTLFKEIGVCKQALSILQHPHDIVDETCAKSIQITNGEIVFENVSFQYNTSRQIFQDHNIKLNAGEKVGLVGFSGSGKTTFAHLILRHFDLEEGRILIDGQDISMVTQDSLRTQIAMIPQEASLFHRSIMENIRYGHLEATDEEVTQAAKQALCDEFISQLPEGYHTLAGERGVNISGGQRQRIAIARAILKNAPILILDEATSALDSVTEKQIQDSLESLMEGRTCLIIAHRLSTLSGMDRILVFHEGKIIEEGTHNDLLKAEGHYAKMWEMQVNGFLPEMV